MDPSSSLLGSSVNDFECFGRQTKIENWLQFSIFNHKTSAENRKTKPCHRLQHCRKSNMDLIFLFIVDRIKVKYKLCFNILSKGNKVQNFRCVCHSSIQFLFKIRNWKLIAIFHFLKFVIRKNTKVQNRKYLTFFFYLSFSNKLTSECVFRWVYYKILYVLSTEVVHVRKSDHAINTNFPLPPPF